MVICLGELLKKSQIEIREKGTRISLDSTISHSPLVQNLNHTQVERFSSLLQISKLSVAKSRPAGEDVVSL